MKPNQKNRYNGRYNGRNSRMMITRNTALESSGPMGKVHGTALQLFEKYQSYAKDALIQNDLILAQTCMQYADHYMRMQNIAIANEQTLRAQNFEQRSNQQTVEKQESDAPESEEIEEADACEPSEEKEALSPEEQAQPTEKEEKTAAKSAEKPNKRKTFSNRRKPKQAGETKVKEEPLLDEEILQQDLSVPIQAIQKNNQN